MKIAILIPCYNEELTVEKVIKDFKKELPTADIYVYDNNSIDKTYQISINSGAIVKKEPRQGKGSVVRSMFRDIDADCYVMIDGDDTYPAEFVHKIIEPIENGEADMVIGDRLSNGTYKHENKRHFHNLGNCLVRLLINMLFKGNIEDIMTGYRAFNKEFVKNFPVLSTGFEIETEMTLHALDKKFLIKEVPIKYRDRPKGSFSKLNTFSDGVRVIKIIFVLFKDYKPLLFFSSISLISLILGLIIGFPVIYQFLRTSYVSKVPSAILSVGLIMISTLLFICGIILDTIVKQYKQMYEITLNKFRSN